MTLQKNTHSPFYAACPKGIESLLFNELQTMGIEGVRETVGGVYFTDQLSAAYRVCLWSRLANKVLLPLTTADISSEKDLYDTAINLPWEDHLAANGSFKIDFIGTNDVIRNSQFGAVRLKDGIVDRFRQRDNQRPSISKDNPDLIFNARLSQGRAGTKDVLHISIDLSGQSLHRRGYRSKQGAAPLKENLAAAVLLRSQWPVIAQQGGALIDPMCGSATLLVEGVMMAADMAPGLLRRHWGFSEWKQFDPEVWHVLLEEARTRKRIGIERLQGQAFEARGYDIDHHVLRAAESNIALAGLSEFIRVSIKNVSELKKPTHKPMETGLVVCNPPYGERLGEEQTLIPVYRQLGQALKSEFLGWQSGIFTANTRLAKMMGIRARKRYKLFNGTLATDVLHFMIQEPSFVREATLAQENKKYGLEGEGTDGNGDNTDISGGDITDEPRAIRHTFDSLTPGAQMVCNRLKKNQKQLRKWQKKSGVQAYRLYDADMPEYSAAIDCYGDWVHVQEYAAPKTVDEKKAEYRFDELLSAIPVALEVEPQQLFIKQRRKNKGAQQYERLQANDSRAMIAIKEPRFPGDRLESQAVCLINLWSYLDSGLFLDHRPVRQLIGGMSNGKRFLNLFCYTATASIHAALGGAVASVSVDMSKTYTHWAEQNFAANNMNSERHTLVQQDCVSWLAQCRQGFDIILLDPPSFSNSKRMEGVFDVQQDHTDMIHRCMELLNPGGTLIFSNNLRSFRLDSDITDTYSVDNITAKTLDADFQRNPKIHHCFLITAA